VPGTGCADRKGAGFTKGKIESQLGERARDGCSTQRKKRRRENLEVISLKGRTPSDEKLGHGEGATEETDLIHSNDGRRNLIEVVQKKETIGVVHPIQKQHRGGELDANNIARHRNTGIQGTVGENERAGGELFTKGTASLGTERGKTFGKGTLFEN